METNVETKFNIGDLVYSVELYHEYYASKEPYTVVGIDIDISEHATKIRYRLERDGAVNSAIEDMLFATYEDCIKWCEEHY